MIEGCLLGLSGIERKEMLGVSKHHTQLLFDGNQRREGVLSALEHLCDLKSENTLNRFVLLS